MIPSDLKFNSGKVQPIVGIFAERCICSLLTRNLVVVLIKEVTPSDKKFGRAALKVLGRFYKLGRVDFVEYFEQIFYLFRGRYASIATEER